MNLKGLTLFVSLCLSSSFAAAECFDWPLREKNQRWAYDGDTVYITMPGLPDRLSNMSVRLDGVDTPELGKGSHCAAEHAKADAARLFLEDALRAASVIRFCDVVWGEFGGRLRAELMLDGLSATQLLIAADHGQPYKGGEKREWCDE